MRPPWSLERTFLKKLYTESLWKEKSRRAQARELVASRRRRALRSVRAKTRVGVPLTHVRERNAVRITKRFVAPSHFSLVENTEPSVSFLRDLREGTHREDEIYVDLSRVETLTPDAITALLGVLATGGDAKPRGNFPQSPGAAAMLNQSGFRDYVQSSAPGAQAVFGKIAERQSHKVEPRTAQDLIDFATHSMYGIKRFVPGAYRILIEAMANTFDHAAPDEKASERWFATVFCNPALGRAEFAFLDNGIGIFKSIKLKPYRRMLRKIGITSNAEILRDIMDGKIESRTGLKYRGKGLPAIANVYRNNRIANLVIVSDDVVASLPRAQFVTLKRPFRGTLIYWELVR